MGQAEVPKQERWEVEPIRKEAEEGLAFGLCSTIWGSRGPEQSRGVGWLCSFGEREPELDSDREVVGVALREGVAVGRNLWYRVASDTTGLRVYHLNRANRPLQTAY